MKAVLGKTPQGKAVAIDMPKLMESRLLVTASSGSGKSQTLRRLFEQTAPLVQQIIIDPEGEFATLREKFDYVICAPHDGDAVAHPRTAALLARRLLESGVSAICDIYDLDRHDRLLFVKIFLETMIDAPKSLWHPVLVGLDEAHEFAPEQGAALSAQAVASMATRGRKRGFCLVPATQRLSKLNKDVAAEMKNKLIGGMNLDLDVKRAAGDLGMTPKEATPLLRNLEPGQFYCYGPALSRDVILVEVGPVVTTHLKAGQRMMKAPPAPSAKVKKELEALADLPQQAEEEARTLEQLQAQNRELERKLAAKPVPVAAPVSKMELEEARRQGYDKGLREAPAISPAILTELGQFAAAQAAGLRPLEALLVRLRKTPPRAPAPPSAPPSAPSPRVVVPAPEATVDPSELSNPQRRIIDILAELEIHQLLPATRATVAAHVGVSVRGSGFEKNIGTLRTLGYITFPAPGEVDLTDTGRARAKPPMRGLTLEQIQERWLGVVSGPQRKLLEALIETYPRSLTRIELAERVGVSHRGSGFEKNVGTLSALGAAVYPEKGRVKAAPVLFPANL